MSAPIICTIGHCTNSSAKVCVVADEAARFVRLAFRIDGGKAQHRDVPSRAAEPYQLATVGLDGLPSGATVEYAVCVSPDVGGLELPEQRLTRETSSFRLLPSDRPLRLGVLSCNGVHKVPREGRYAMWTRLAECVAAGEVDLLLHVGDQIYADALKESHDVCAESAHADELAAAYRRWTVNTWRPPEVARVLASCPSVMMWDDHDIYDGWGSNDGDRAPEARAFFDGARVAFEELQASHNPARIDPSSYATGFMHQSVGVLLLDARTHRDYSAGVVVGDAQWSAVDAWLEKARAADLRHLFVVVGTPPVHLRVAVDQWIHEITPWTESATDDLRDAWISKNNQPEAERLVARLFDFQVRSPGTRVTLVAGDVHVSTIGRLESSREQHVSGRALPVVHQIVSSPIGYTVPTGLVAWLLRRATKKRIEVAPGIVGDLVDLVGVDTDRILARRNFAVIRCDDGDDGWHPDAELRVRYYAEGLAAPLEQKLSRG